MFLVICYSSHKKQIPFGNELKRYILKEYPEDQLLQLDPGPQSHELADGTLWGKQSRATYTALWFRYLLRAPKCVAEERRFPREVRSKSVSPPDLGGNLCLT